MKSAVLCALLSAAPAFAAETPVCLTISAPGKWSAGIVLRIAKEKDGTTSANLLGYQMFRGRSNQNDGDALNFQLVRNITTTQISDNTISYSGGDGTYNAVNVRIGNPNDYGHVEGSISLKFGDMTINSTSAEILKHQDGSACN